VTIIKAIFVTSEIGTIVAVRVIIECAVLRDEFNPDVEPHGQGELQAKYTYNNTSCCNPQF
jgi:hypothetical protein